MVLKFYFCSFALSCRVCLQYHLSRHPSLQTCLHLLCDSRLTTFSMITPLVILYETYCVLGLLCFLLCNLLRQPTKSYVPKSVKRIWRHIRQSVNIHVGRLDQYSSLSVQCQAENKTGFSHALGEFLDLRVIRTYNKLNQVKSINHVLPRLDA